MRAELWEQRLQPLRECAEQGMTVAQAADHLGLSRYTVYRYAERFGMTFVEGQRGTPRRVSDPRSEAMLAMYRAGRTLEDIGSLYGITRERVRQILKKYHGVNAKAGGAAVTSARRREQAQKRKEAACQQKNGCSLAEYRGLLEQTRKMRHEGVGYYRTPLGAFRQQRQRAKDRGIPWRMTVWEWWTAWQESGRWGERGRGADKYVMCRFGDTGPYEIGNIYFATHSHNSSVQPNNKRRKSHPDHASVQARAA